MLRPTIYRPSRLIGLLLRPASATANTRPAWEPPAPATASTSLPETTGGRLLPPPGRPHCLRAAR